MRHIILLFALCFFASFGYSQDTIILKNGDQFDVKITSIDDGQVKFYYADDPEKIIVTMNRSLIRKIKFEYGRTEDEVTPGMDESYYVDDKRNNILINFTAIANDETIIGYEHSMSPSTSISGYIKFPGLGVNQGNYDNGSGFGLEVDYKLKTGAVFKKNQYRPQHLLKGFYLRPDLGFTTAKFDNKRGYFFSTPAYSEKYTYIYGGFDIGKQWVFNNLLALDLYTGLNFYGGNYDATNVSTNETYDKDSVIRDGNLFGENGVASRFGIQLGVLFN